MDVAVLENAESLLKNSPEEAAKAYSKIVLTDVKTGDEGSTKIKEQAILQLGSLLAKGKKADDLGELIKLTRPFLTQISKPKAAKLVKALVDKFLDMEAKTGNEVQLCQDCISWAKGEKRVYLRQALEARLVALYYETTQYNEALALGNTLLKELKKLDDKILLVEVQLLESKVYYALQNLPKARAALTSGRTTANGIYCPPKLQSALDLQSGILHAADERDFKTAFSYFYEAFEGYDSIDSPKAITGLKYMLLSKIMLELADEVQQIVSGKLALKYSGPAVEAMISIAKASADRSLAQFQETLTKYATELTGDVIIKSHLDSLYDKLLEQNLCRIIEPFSRVDVSHISKLIALPIDVVERKLSKMILDKKISGILSQGEGVLIVFDESPADKTYEGAISTIKSLGKVVDSLYNKAKKLT